AGIARALDRHEAGVGAEPAEPLEAAVPIGEGLGRHGQHLVVGAQAPSPLAEDVAEQLEGDRPVRLEGRCPALVAHWPAGDIRPSPTTRETSSARVVAPTRVRSE